MPDPQNQNQGQTLGPDPNRQVSIDEWEGIVQKHFGIPKSLWRAMSSQESGNDWNAVSPTGVKGKWQVTQATARQYGYNRDDPFDQVFVAGKHLKTLYDGLSGIKDESARWLASVGRYYGGPSAVDAQGNISATSRDGLSNPVTHIERVAKKWGELSRADSSATAPQASAAPSATPAPQYDGRGRRKIGYADAGIVPAEGTHFDLSGGKTGNAPAQSPTRSQAPAKAPTRQQQMTALAEAMRARDAKPEHIAEAQQRLSKLSNADFAKESARLFKLFGTVPEYATQRAEQERKRAEYYAQPLYQQIGQEIVGGMARVGEGAQRAANRALRPALEAVGFKEEVARGQRGEEATAQKLAEKEELANSLRSKIVRGTTAGAGNAAIMAPLAMVGGAPAVTLATAAQQDWEKDPAGALAATAGAAVPIYAGRAITPLAGRAANAFTSPVAGKAAQLGVEGLAGAGANVGQYAATQAALGRPVNADDLIEQGVTGGMLSAALAPKLPGRRASAPVIDETMAAPLRSQTARESATQDYASRVEPGMLARGYVRQVEEINRTVADPQAKQAALDQARTQYQEARRTLQVRPEQTAPAVADQTTAQVAPTPAETIPQEAQPTRAVRPGTEEMTPEFRAKAQRQALEMMGYTPEQIEAEIARRAPIQAETSQPVAETATRAPRLQPALAVQSSLESALRQEPAPIRRKAGEDVQIFRAGEQPEYDPATQKVVTFKGSDRQDYIAIAPKQMSRSDAAAFGRSRIQPGQPAQRQAARQSEAPPPLLRPDAQVNPEGGIPKATKAPVNFKAPERAPVDKGSNVSLEQFVINEGGLRRSAYDRGEAKYLTGREGGRPGAVNNLGLHADELRLRANDAGYGPYETVDDFMRALTDVGRTEKPQSFNPDIEAARRAEMGENEQADATAFQKLLEDPPLARAYDEITSGHATPEKTAEFLEGAQRYGLSARGIAEVLHSGQQAEAAPEPSGRGESPRASSATDSDLMSGYRKLGTDDPAEISQLLRDADKRFKKSATEGEKAAADRAWTKVQRLTPAEQQALSTVIPERVFAPVRDDYTGETGERYSRAVSDIPLSEKNAQLDKNLADLLNFFDEVQDKPKPKLVENAAQRLKENATGRRAGSGGQQLVDMAIVAGWKVYERGMTYAQWAKEVIKEAGEWVRPHLQAAWRQLQSSGVGQFLKDEGGSAKLGLGIPEAIAKRGKAAETVGGLQTAAQLGNPRFVIRNVLQHVAYGKQERGATRLAAALDWAFSHATGKPRQITGPRGSDLASYVRNWGKALDAYKNGQPLPGKLNADYLTPNANALDKAVGKVMAYINEIPDAANWQTRFESSLKSIVEASKKSGAKYDVDDVVNQAWAEANRAALRDKNFVSSAALKIKQAFNTASSPITGTDKWGLGDFVLKYAQTPGALLKRGLEHSPLGLFEVAKQAATPGPFRRRNTLLALSRVMAGTAEGLGLGAALAAAGVLVGPEEEDKTGQSFEREQGVRGFSFNASALCRLLTGESSKLRAGDQLYSIDWLQPWAMSASAGAAIYNLHKDGKLGPGKAAGATGEAMYDSLAKTLDVMGDQSILKNLSRYASKATGESFTDKALNFMKAVGLDVPSSFVPSIARQVRQVIDPYERDTRPENREGLKGFAREAINRAEAQLPGVSQTFPTRPSVLTGQPKKTALGEMSVPGRIAAQFSPANISTYALQPVAREIGRLNRAGEKVSVSPPRWEANKQTGKPLPLALQRDAEARFALSFATESKALINHPRYKNASNEVKATAINSLARQLRERIRKPGASNKSISEIIERAEASAALGK